MYEKKNIKILARFLLYLIALASVFLYGVINTYALETKTIYNGINSSGSLTGSNTYNYGYLTGGGTIGISSASVGSTVSGVAYGFSFRLYESVVLTKTYTLKINFKSTDLLPSFTSQMIRIASCNNNVCNDSGIISLIKQSNTNNSSYITINFAPTSVGSTLLVELSNNTNPITGVDNFGISSVQIESQNANQDIMNNASQNANNIINSQNSSASSIIDNQNQNTQDIIDSQYTCKSQTLSNFSGDNNVALNSSGSLESADDFVVTEYIRLKSTLSYTLLKDSVWGTGRAYCLYNNNQELINCYTYGNSTSFTITGANYIRYTWSTYGNRYVKITGDICIKDSTQQTNAINDLNDSINDDDIGGASQDGADFILDFDTNTFGLTSIVTAPLNLIQSLTSSTCSELELPLPFLNNKKLKLPCMTTIYQNTFGTLFTIYQTITFGIIAYWVCVRIFNQVKDFKNPEHDEIEVVDL